MSTTGDRPNHSGSRLTRLAGRLTLLLGLALVAGFVAAGPADASVSATCDLSGILQTQPPVQLFGGSGTYIYDNFATPCEGTIDGVNDVFTLQLTTSGTYVSQNCTTQAYDSTTAVAVVATSIAGNVGKSFQFPYHIDASGGIGQMWFLSPAKGLGTFGFVPTGPQVPNGPTPSTWPCMDQFTVEGEFTITIP